MCYCVLQLAESQTELEQQLGAKLVLETLDVNYEKTKLLVPQRWEEHKPKVRGGGWGVCVLQSVYLYQITPCPV